MANNKITSTQKAAILIWRMKDGEEFTISQVSKIFDITFQGARRVLHTIAAVLPIAPNDDGVWQICLDFNEQELLFKKVENNYTRNKDGFVYFIKSDNGLVKIGKSAHPERRLRELKTGAASKLKLVETIYSEDVSGLEKRLHLRYKRRRKNGEWFELSHEEAVEELYGVSEED